MPFRGWSPPATRSRVLSRPQPQNGRSLAKTRPPKPWTPSRARRRVANFSARGTQDNPIARLAGLAAPERTSLPSTGKDARQTLAEAPPTRQWPEGKESQPHPAGHAQSASISGRSETMSPKRRTYSWATTARPPPKWSSYVPRHARQHASSGVDGSEETMLHSSSSAAGPASPGSLSWRRTPGSLDASTWICATAVSITAGTSQPTLSAAAPETQSPLSPFDRDALRTPEDARGGLGISRRVGSASEVVTLPIFPRAVAGAPQAGPRRASLDSVGDERQFALADRVRGRGLDSSYLPNERRPGRRPPA